MERDPSGGSDVGRDIERDLGDEPPAAIRDAAPDYLGPIDASAPVSGHTPAPGGHDVGHRLARARLDARPGPHLPGVPAGRDAGPRPLDRSIATRSRRMPTVSHAQPLLDVGPAGLPVVYTIDAGAYDIVVNGDHLLSWGVGAVEIQDAAMRNLARWSATAPWTDEISGDAAARSARTPATAGTPSGSCCPRSSPHLDDRARAVRADPHRPAGAAPADGGLAAPRRRRVRRAVRRLRRRAVRRRRRARSTGASSSSWTAGSSSSTGADDRADGRDRRRDPAFDVDPLRGRGRDRDDHARSARGAQRPDGPDEGRAAARRSRLVARDRSVRAVVLTGAGPGVLRRPGPQGAARARRGAARDRAARALQPDHPRDARRSTSRSSGRSTGSPPAPAPRSPSPATCGSPADGASFVLAFGRIGLVPDSGATWFLPRLVGGAKAAELALLGDTVSARRRGALRAGRAGRARRRRSPTEARAMATPAGRARAGGPRLHEARAGPRRGRSTSTAPSRRRRYRQGVAGATARPRRGDGGLPREAAAAVHRGVAVRRPGPCRRGTPVP